MYWDNVGGKFPFPTPRFSVVELTTGQTVSRSDFRNRFIKN